jgi:hypothetical protein
VVGRTLCLFGRLRGFSQMERGQNPRTVMKSGFKYFLIGVCALCTAVVLVVGLISITSGALTWVNTGKATPAVVTTSSEDLVTKTARAIQPKVDEMVKEILSAAQADAKAERDDLAQRMRDLAEEIKAYGTKTP